MYGQFEGFPLRWCMKFGLVSDTDPCKINILKPKIIQLKRKIIFQTSIFWVYVTMFLLPTFPFPYLEIAVSDAPVPVVGSGDRSG